MQQIQHKNLFGAQSDADAGADTGADADADADAVTPSSKTRSYTYQCTIVSRTAIFRFGALAVSCQTPTYLLYIYTSTMF